MKIIKVLSCAILFTIGLLLMDYSFDPMTADLKVFGIVYLFGGSFLALLGLLLGFYACIAKSS